MSETRILIVEDEGIVAMEIKDRLEKLGYSVPAVASSGEEAIRMAREVRPDLVLMDIILKGKMDGIEAAEHVRRDPGAPVIYLTAYSDPKTLSRAKITEPFGYILKPFDERELQTAIELGLYKHKMETRLKESEQWLATTLRSIGDAVITADKDGMVNFMNPTAEALTGWSLKDAKGRKLEEIFSVVREDTLEPSESLIKRALDEKAPSGKEHNLLISRDGRKIPVDAGVAPLKDPYGDLVGLVLAFKDITDRRRAEIDLKIKEKAMSSAINAIALTDAAGRLIYVNDSFQKLWDYRRDEVLGRPASDLWQIDQKALQEALIAEGRWRGETKAFRKDGMPFEAHFSASAVTDSLDRIDCIMYSIIDITELKHAEAELNKYSIKIDEADRVLESLSERITRDLQESLRSLDNLSQLLAKGCGGVADDGSEKYLKEVEVTREKIRGLVDDLLVQVTPISLYLTLIGVYQDKIQNFKGPV